MMRFELGLETPDPKRARISALTIGISYIVGGLIPLSPYILIHDISIALMTPLQKGRDAISLSISGAKLLKMTSKKRLLLAETAKNLPKWGEIADGF